MRGLSSRLSHQHSVNADQKICDSKGREFLITTNLKKSPHPHPAKPGRGDKIAHRANDLAMRSPSCDANENPLTLTLSPQSWGEGTRKLSTAHEWQMRADHRASALKRNFGNNRVFQL